MTEEEQVRLRSALSYWKKNFSDDEDLRKLAFVLANIHRDKPQVRTDPDKPKDPTPAAKPLTEDELEKYFGVAKAAWIGVKHTTGETDGPISDLHLPNIFFTVLSKMQPLNLSQVLGELKSTKGWDIPRDDLESVFKKFHEANLTALCFSGGGIRSATFGLGIVQALAKYNLLEKFDYLSTVSGGGYLGSWMSAWICRERNQKSGHIQSGRSEGPRACRHRREMQGPIPPIPSKHLGTLKKLAESKKINPKLSDTEVAEFEKELSESLNKDQSEAALGF